MTHSTLVIGAGVSGLSAALILLEQGHTVSLLDQGEIGRESSWAGGGILCPLLPWEYACPATILSLRSMTNYARWIAHIESVSGLTAEYWSSGMRVLGVPSFDQPLAWCKTHGLAAEPQHTATGTSLWLPNIAQVRNPRLIAALREAVLNLGGMIRSRCPVKAIRAKGSRMVSVHTTQGDMRADQFVLATGAWSGLSFPGLAGVPNVRPIRGQMLLFKLAPGMLDTIVYRRGVYLIPRQDGHVLVGSTVEDAGFDKLTDEATGRRLHAEAAELLPALRAMQPIRHWAGLRPGAPDNIPIIDRHPDFDNVFVNTGHYRYGVTMAPASAELLADLIEGRTPVLDPAPYRWQAALERRWTAAL